MPVGNNQAAIAAQKEAIRPDLPQLMLLSSVLWGRLEARTDITPVGSRPTRVPTQPQVGGQVSVGGFDGQNLGRGSGPQEVPGYLSCASYLQASEWTLQADWATDSSAKAIQNYVSLTHEQGFETFGSYMDVFAQMDGSNTIDTIVSVVTGGLVVNLANYFQSNQLVDIWTAVGGALVATLQISIEDIRQNTLWMTTAIPAGVLAGMAIMVHGSSGQANSGMFGLKYYDVGTDVGNFMGIPRASYPGRYIANNINLNNQSLTPSVIRALQVAGVLALGPKVAGQSEPVAHCNADMQTAWEANYLGVQTATRNDNRTDQALDMLPKAPVTMMGGREILLNPRATPGRIDFLDLRDWWRLETRPTDYISFGGQTEFPIVGNDGGLASSTIFYIAVQTNMGVSNVRRSSFVSNAAIPKYIFGR